MDGAGISGSSAEPAARPAVAEGAFRASRLGPADLGSIPTIVARRNCDPRRLLAIVRRLAVEPPGAFVDLAALCAELGIEGGASRSIVRSLRDLFLEIADARLQAFYRGWLAANPPPAGAAHEARIAHLGAARAEVQAIVDRFGWPWLARWLDLARIGSGAADCVAQLSNLGFPVATVNFRFTYHCNIACRHCYNSSGPGRKAERIALDRMVEIVAQMPEAGLDRLIITGGEPFLYPNDVFALIRAARAAGVGRISINSNAFWATSDDRARAMLAKLAEAGFQREPRDNLKVSSGIYHTEFVDLDRIFTLARAYRAMFGRPLPVDFELEAGVGGAREAAVERFRAAGVIDCVAPSFRTISPLGRARDLEGLPTSECAEPCGIIDQIVFDPDGKVRPCCGLNNENLGIVVGSTEAHGLRDLVKRLQNDPLLQFFATRPMNAIFAELGREPKPGGYSGICDLCQDAVGALADKEPIQAKLFAGQRFYPFWFEA